MTLEEASYKFDYAEEDMQVEFYDYPSPTVFSRRLRREMADNIQRKLEGRKRDLSGTVTRVDHGRWRIAIDACAHCGAEQLAWDFVEVAL
jgi:hypothetical protein